MAQGNKPSTPLVHPSHVQFSYKARGSHKLVSGAAKGQLPPWRRRFAAIIDVIVVTLLPSGGAVLVLALSVVARMCPLG